MSIISPARGPWRTPSADPPLVFVDGTRFGDRDVIVLPGADLADLVAALVTLPADVLFTGAFADPELTLVFRATP